MSAKFTPGPWVINTAGSAKAGSQFVIDEIYVYAPETQDDTAICADVIDPVTQKPSEANARLISTAPELLEALQSAQMALIGYVHQNDITRNALEKARAAIAKATGDQQ